METEDVLGWRESVLNVKKDTSRMPRSVLRGSRRLLWGESRESSAIPLAESP